MLKVVKDDVGEHDLLHPCCRPEMYDFFYHNGECHPNCFDNINGALGEERPQITPVNLFMYTKINEDGSISVKVPLSKAGESIVLEALMDITLGVEIVKRCTQRTFSLHNMHPVFYYFFTATECLLMPIYAYLRHTL